MPGNQPEQGDKRIHTMAVERPVKAVLKMGVPVAMGMLFMVAYNLVDTWFIGMLHDDYQLAATNLAYPVMMVMIAMAGIVGNGGASYIARCIGAGEREEANRTLTIGFELVLFLSIAFAVLGLALLHPLVLLLGAKENTALYTGQYVAVLLLGALFVMGNYAFGQLLRSEGSTFYSMVGMIAGTVANILLDPLFIFTLGMEIKGAAIATVLGNGLGMAVCLYYYGRGKTLLRPALRYRRLDGRIIREILWVGIPHTFEQLFTTAGMVVMNNLAVGYGELAVAAMGVSNKLMSFGSYLYQGLTAGCQPLMGYNYGARNFPRMKALIRAGVLVTTAMELAVMAGFALLAPVLIGLFSQTGEVIELGTRTLRAAVLMLPFVGATSISRNTFNAMGKPLFAFGITVVRQLVLYIPMLLLFSRLWGYTGLIHAQPVEEAVCMVLALAVLFLHLNRLERGEETSDRPRR